MFKKIKIITLFALFTVLSLNPNLKASVAEDKNLWSSKVSEDFHKLVSKDLLSFGKSDPAATAKDELLERAKTLKASLGGFIEVIASSVDDKKIDRDKDKKHDKPMEAVVKAPETPVAVVPAPILAPVVAPSVLPAPAVLPVVPPAPIVVAPIIPSPVNVEVPSPAVLPAVPVVPVIAPHAAPAVPVIPAPAVLPAPPVAV